MTARAKSGNHSQLGESWGVLSEIDQIDNNNPSKGEVRSKALSGERSHYSLNNQTISSPTAQSQQQDSSKSSRLSRSGLPNEAQTRDGTRSAALTTPDRPTIKPMRRPKLETERTISEDPQFIMPSPSTTPHGEALWVDADIGASPVRQRRRQNRQSKNVSLPSESDTAEDSSPQRKRSSKPRGSSKYKSRTPSDNAGSNVFAAVWTHMLVPTIKWSLGVVGTAFSITQPLFGFLLVAALIIAGLRYMLPSLSFLAPLGMIGTGLSSIVSPLQSLVTTPLMNPCSVPIISALPFCAGHSASTQHQQPQFKQLVAAQSSFEEILESANQNADLPIHMKRSEASIRDLRFVVEYSSLPSRNELVLEFQNFIAASRQASADLITFNVRINTAVDHIVAINRNTLHVLDGIERSAYQRGQIDGWLAEAPFPINGLASGPSVALTQQKLFTQYMKHTAQVETQILKLIGTAQTLLQVLQGLEDKLDVMHEICARDDENIKRNQEELLAYLWSKLGGNKKQITKMEENLKLLRAVSDYRKQAWAHVSATIIKLQAIAAELEALREKVGQPGLAGEESEEEIGLLQHIRTIQAGVTRLEEQRSIAKDARNERQRQMFGDIYDDGTLRTVNEDRMIGGKTM